MKLPPDSFIAREKAIAYLLVRQSRSDKSAFLAGAGYTLENPDTLLASLDALRTHGDAVLVDENKFGRYYEVVGILSAPNGISLRVRTIWMTEHLSGITKFITLIPIGTVRT